MPSSSTTGSVHWLRQRKLALGLASLAGISLAFVPWRVAFESVFFLALILCISRLKLVRIHFSELSRAQQGWVCGLIALLMAAQLADISRKSFPFVNWTMYSKSTPLTSSVFALKAVCSDGSSFDIPTNPFPTHTLNAATRLKSLLEKRDTVKPGKREALESRIRQLEDALRNACAVRSGGRPVTSLILMEGTINLSRRPELVDWAPCHEIRFLR